jgi:tetratricopeptide (TPR) repeat protein
MMAKEKNLAVAYSTLALLLVLAIGPGPVSAQPADQSVKYRLAQSYEQGGDFENATKIYAELFAADRTNFVYFDSLRRMYLQLKRYDEAIALLQNRLSDTPSDFVLRSSLASAYYKAGNEQNAQTEWEKVLASDPANVNVYRLVAQSMLEERIFDRAADVYRRARLAANNPTLFTLELAQILSTSMDYVGASREYLSWLKQNPAQLSFVQGRMATFTNKEDGRTAAIAAVSDAIRKSDDPKLYELLGWIHQEGKDYAKALEAYRTLDRLTNAQGGQIYAFAERAFKEHAFSIAAQAYREAIDAPVATAKLPYARYGYALALKEMSAEADTLHGTVSWNQTPATEAQPQYAGAIGYFRAIIEQYPHSEFSAKSYYQIGTIQFTRFFDLDGALASLENVERDFPKMNPIHYDVALRIGEVQTARGDTARAAWRFRLVADAPNATPDQHDEAMFRLAELEYFGGKFKEAAARLADISLNLHADYTNDAIQLQAFLQENQNTGEAALVQFARADFLARQRRNSEASTLFQDLIGKYPQALLTDDALMKVARLQAQSGLFVDAIKSYERLGTEFKDASISLDKAQFAIGEIYQFGLRDTVRAIAAYEKILADSPQSLLAATARKRIRALRGDSL